MKILIYRFDKKTVYYTSVFGGARDVMVIVAGDGHGDMSSNPGRD